MSSLALPSDEWEYEDELNSKNELPLPSDEWEYEDSKPEKSLLEKGGRVASQFGLGVAESAALPYEIATIPLETKGYHVNESLQNLGSELEFLYENNAGKPIEEWSDKDKEMYNFISERIQNPGKVEEEVEPVNVGIRGLAEKATGLDLHPEGVLEKAASWAGMLKDPKKIIDLFKTGIKLPDVYKAIAPTGKEALRGVGAGTALQLAEQGDFGPIGTMASAVIGDLAGGGAAGLVKATKNIVSSPKKSLAKAAAKFTKPEKLALQKEIIKDFRDSGIQADLGSITDSNLIKWTQSRLAQSGLSGKALEEFKQELTGQITKEYKNLANELGEARFTNNHEAGQIAKETMQQIREQDLKKTRELYSQAEKALKEDSFVAPHSLAKAIENVEKQLKPGAIKSTQQQTVLSVLDTLKRDIQDSSGSLMYAKVKDLMNNKIALNDIINYEVQGGQKQLLKGIVAEIDRAIISHGKENPKFSKSYINANKSFSEHAKKFRNKEISKLLAEGDPSQLMNKMNSIQGIRNLERILKAEPEGEKIFSNLKRLKLDQVIENNLVDSATKQVKLGTFSKLLEKGKNREIIKEIMGGKAFARLEKLQKNAGRLADAADKFYNASKTGAVTADAAILAKALSDIAHILYGNPWPLLKTGGGILAARKLNKLLADPEFLKMVEDVILSSEKGTSQELIHSVEMLRPYLIEVNHQNENDSSYTPEAL